MKDRARLPRPLLPFDLIAIDVDGTLLDSNDNLCASAPQAFEKAQEAGIRIALVTGRSQSTLEFIFRQLPVRGPFIGSGGSFIGDLSSGEIIQQRTLPRHEVEKAIHLARQHDLILFLDHSDFMLCEKENEKTRRHKRVNDYNWKIVPDLLQELAYAPEKGLLFGDEDKIKQAYQYYQSGNHDVSITFTGHHSMDILPKGVGKGDALTKLADHLHIPLKRIAVIGDYLNDLEMFAVAGYSIAMGNAPDEVKQAANWVAPTNNENGVSHAIMHIINRTSEEK